MDIDPRWQRLLERYRTYCDNLSLRSKPPKEAKERKAIAKRVRQVDKLMATTVPKLIRDGKLPADPDELRDRDKAWKLAKRAGAKHRRGGKADEGSTWFRQLWRAVVLHHSDYHCDYCGRDFLQTQVEGRVMRLELDHLDLEPRSEGGENYSLDNIRAACRTCNVARGRMPKGLFLAELRSLTEGVSAWASDSH